MVRVVVEIYKHREEVVMEMVVAVICKCREEEVKVRVVVEIYRHMEEVVMEMVVVAICKCKEEEGMV